MESAKEPDSPATPATPPYRLVESSDLLAGDRTVLIRHENELYRLTVTRNGKLLLQK